LIGASLAPTTLHVPIPMRPWVFLLSIAWTLLIFSGVFTS
jgi:hypothetical protein